MRRPGAVQLVEVIPDRFTGPRIITVCHSRSALPRNRISAAAPANAHIALRHVMSSRLFRRTDARKGEVPLQRVSFLYCGYIKKSRTTELMKNPGLQQTSLRPFADARRRPLRNLLALETATLPVGQDTKRIHRLRKILIP